LLPDDAVHHLWRVVIVGLAKGIGTGFAGRHGRVNRGDIDMKRRIALGNAGPKVLDIVLLASGEGSCRTGALESWRVAWRRTAAPTAGKVESGEIQIKGVGRPGRLFSTGTPLV
jgi:hypothetical protein